jgi:hypothetical protein
MDICFLYAEKDYGSETHYIAFLLDIMQIKRRA